MHLYCSDESTAIFESGNDLDLRSNFTVDLSRSTYISFDATGREKDVIVSIGLPPFLNCNFLLENYIGPFRPFYLFLPLEAICTVDLR